MTEQTEMQIARSVLQRMYDAAPETPPKDLSPKEIMIMEGIKDSMLIVLDVLNVIIDGERLEIFRENPSDGEVAQ